MIATLLIWLAAGFTILLIGRGTLRLASAFLFPGRPLCASVALTFLGGLAAVTALALFLSLFINLGAAAVLGVMAAAGLILLYEWRTGGLAGWKSLFAPGRLHPLTWVFAVLLFLTVLELSTHQPANPDTGIYHAQAIRWMETFPAVPGLGNLHSRLAYDSSWLALNALFSFSFAGLMSFHAIPGLALVLFLFWGLGGMEHLLRGSRRLSDWTRLALIPLTFLTLSSEASSPGTDLPARLLLWFLLGEGLAEFETAGEQPLRPLILSAAATLAVTVKLSALPAVILPLFFAINALHRRALRPFSGMILVVVLSLAPWMARNVILSGYLVYPEPSIDLFSFDWKIPAGRAAEEKTVIQAWARLPGEDVAVTLATPFNQWSRQWYSKLATTPRVMLWGLLAGPLMSGFMVCFWRRFRRLIGGIIPFWPLYVLFYGGSFFWFISAPAVRFGVGWLTGALLLGLLPLGLLALNLVDSMPRRIGSAAPLIVAIGLILAQCGLLYRNLEVKTLAQRLALPLDYPTLPTSPCSLQNKTIFCADLYSECWYAPFPCAVSGDENVQMRGPSLADGFRRIATPEPGR